jgi:hypothetical protein
MSTGTLGGVIAQLGDLDDDLCIFAKRPWTAATQAETFFLRGDSGIPDEPRRLELDYFLEVHIAREVLEDSDLSLESHGLDAVCRRLIEYAERDT